MRSFIPFAIVFILYSIFGALPAFLFIGVADTTWANIAYFLTHFLFMIAVFIWYVKKNGYWDFLLKKQEILLLGFSLILTVGTLFLLYILQHYEHVFNAELFVVRWYQVDSSAIIFDNIQINNIAKPTLNIGPVLRGLICAPIFESILVLSLFQNKMYEKMPPYIAIIISAIVFALIHLNLSDIFGLFISGLLFGLVYYKSKNLTIPILCHFLWNFVATFLVFIPTQINGESLIALLLVTIGFVVSLLYILKYN
ncbi:CPBP family intramembrane metalloprotease [Paludibacter sp. 221]|uniref:CPBP family intramembrane glutamic endopeptidase n=1 Tax=Paludibacter sp. 221 TaxID=2302939 RepID=UPI0013D3135E|nr:type II CAAX endopeptidase family protein [Paludibacter sp. 221]NDV45521.1 CPBP family intramembrane metalloprotease [Paludibacter sp. 221]